jgi:hypothetical protein
MKRQLVLAAPAAATVLSATPAAEAHGHIGLYPVYPVYSYCRWYRTPYGPVQRCFY